MHRLAQLCDHRGVIRLFQTVVSGASVTGGIAVRTPAEEITARVAVTRRDCTPTRSRRRSAAGRSAFTRAGANTRKSCRRGASSCALWSPLPHPRGHGLGVHLSRTTWGNVTVGPTVRFQDAKDDYENDRLPVEAFYEPTRELLPDLRPSDLQLGGSGIRAKLHGPEGSFEDFLIERDPLNPCLIQAAGIESPGLTACLAVAEEVERLTRESPVSALKKEIGMRFIRTQCVKCRRKASCQDGMTIPAAASFAFDSAQ